MKPARLTRHAEQAALDARAIDARHPTWHALQTDQLRDSYPTSGGQPGSSGTISRPTENAALNNTDGPGTDFRTRDRINWAETQLAGITHDWQNLIDRQRALLDFLHLDTPEQAGLPPRCNGAHLPGAHLAICDGGWHDPTCSNDAALYTRADGTTTLRRNGLCETCAKRRQRAGWPGTDTSGEPAASPQDGAGCEQAAKMDRDTHETAGTK